MKNLILLFLLLASFNVFAQCDISEVIKKDNYLIVNDTKGDKITKLCVKSKVRWKFSSCIVAMVYNNGYKMYTIEIYEAHSDKHFKRWQHSGFIKSMNVIGDTIIFYNEDGKSIKYNKEGNEIH